MRLGGGSVSEFELGGVVGGRHYYHSGGENVVESYKARAASIIQAHWKGYKQRQSYERLLIEQFTA